MNIPTRYLVTLAVAVASVLAVILVVTMSSASGAGFSLSSDIDIDRGERGDPGTNLVLVSQATPTELVGRACTSRTTSLNNESIHPGNDLIVETGSEVLTFEGVEETASAVNEVDTNVVLGPTVTMTLRFGSSGVTSTQFTIAFDCPDTPATTVTTPSTTVTVPPTTLPVPPTTTPPSEPEPPSPCDPAKPGSPCTLTG